MRLTIEFSRSPKVAADVARPGRHRRIRGVVATLVAAAVLAPVAVQASHQYDDVATSNKYHTPIDAISDAGITKGCKANLYCPTSFIRRDHLATWLTRSSSRITEDTDVLDATVRDVDGEVTVGSVTITVPGLANSTQFVEVVAQISVQEGTSDCPCTVFAELRPSGSFVNFADAIGHVPTGGVFLDSTTVTVIGVIAAAPGVHTYDVAMSTVGASAIMDVLEVRLIARTVPFGGTGGNSL